MVLKKEVEMRKLFECIPENYFNLFTGKNRGFYAEVAFLLYEQFHINRAGILYSLMKDEIQELIETKEELGECIDVEDEMEERVQDSAERANVVLRRLKKLKWIDVEVRDQFEEFIVLPVYSSRILAVLKEICENRTIEYQRYCFTTYQLLTGVEAEERPASAILESEKYSEQLYDELTILLHNMKNHMETIAAKDDIQQVLEHHFGEYKKDIIDKSYHRLRTSDHVSRYRNKILERIQTWFLDDEFMKRAAKDAVESGYSTSQEEVMDVLSKKMYRVEEIYSNLDEICNQIDARHYQYLRAVLDRSRYLSTYNDSTDYKISYILEHIRQTDENIFDSSPFRLVQFRQLQEASLLSPRKKKGVYEPEQHEVTEISEEMREELKAENLRRIEKVINRKKIRKFVLEAMKGRQEIEMSELDLQNEEDALYLIYVYLYGYSRDAGYTLSEESPDFITQRGYTFSNRTIKREN
ncbi:hypothetical protein bcere0021_8310 [Bacillus cereus Rock3-42]|nr:hypothetical protein bcere0021_8310 [Bacillus cereus Rock3-42]